MTIREVAAGAYREALPVLVVSAGGGLFAGLVLGGMDAELRSVPGLLLLVPAILATRGNVYGSLGARIGTGLHQGLIEESVSVGDPRLRRAIAAALLNGIAISVVAGVAAVGLLTALGRSVAPLGTLVAITFVSGVLSGLVLTTTVVTVVVAGYRRGLDPDTLAGPVVTTTGDLVGVAMLLLSVRVVFWLGGG